MKKIKKLKGHTTTKYGTTFTELEQKVNELIDCIRELQNEITQLKSVKL